MSWLEPLFELTMKGRLDGSTRKQEDGGEVKEKKEQKEGEQKEKKGKNDESGKLADERQLTEEGSGPSRSPRNENETIVCNADKNKLSSNFW